MAHTVREMVRDRLLEFREDVAERVGVQVVPRERVELLEARSMEAGALRRELDALAWTALNYSGGRRHDLKPEKRREIVQKALIVWMKDPQAGAAVDLMNDFVFGRGLSRPKAVDPDVQTVLDDWWDDVDNQMVLTSSEAQSALGVDLALQSNIFLQVFDEGEDGRVKFDLLDHDYVENVVKDTDGSKQRVLYYVVREPQHSEEWDFDADQPKWDPRVLRDTAPVLYYRHWRNVEEAESEAERGLRPEPQKPPPAKLGEGKVYHVSLNRTTKMSFGHPTFDRLIKWYNAYNAFIDARMDIIQAKAAFVMRVKADGTPNQIQRMAQQSLSRRGAIGSALDPDLTAGPKAGSIQHVNDKVAVEDVSLDTGAAGALQDSQMIRAQTSAGTRFPQSYYGDASNSNLATATSLELPVLKAVERRQEIFEQIVRFGADRAIKRAVETGRLSRDLPASQVEEAVARRTKRKLLEYLWKNGVALPVALPWESTDEYAERVYGMVEAHDADQAHELLEAHEDAARDEVETQRDLSYEFQMPSPLKRMMGELVTAVAEVARTFDPNGTNLELSRLLLGVVLGEGFEFEDPQGAVERVFPEGYVDPAMQAMQQQAQAAPDSAFGEFGPAAANATSQGADGQQHSGANPYGAPMQARMPETAMGITEAMRGTPLATVLGLTIRRDGTPMEWRELDEGALERLPRSMREALVERRREVDEQFAGTLAGVLRRHESNGNGNGRG